jgi:hypothetical protein
MASADNRSTLSLPYLPEQQEQQMRIIVVNSHCIRRCKHAPSEDEKCSPAWHLGIISVARRERVNLEVSIVSLA